MNTRGNEKPWHKNAGHYLIVNSIFAVISVLLIDLIFHLFKEPNINKYLACLSLLLGVVAMLILIVTSEKIPEAVEEDDVEKYIAYMFPYNFAVLFFFVGLNLYIFQSIQSGKISAVVSGVVLVLGIVLLAPFWKAVGWHIRPPEGKFDKYIRELEDKKLPERKRKRDRFSFTGFYYKYVRRDL